MMLNAMVPQLHHQQPAGGDSGDTLMLGASSSSASSSSVATISTSPSSSSSSASSSTATNYHHNNNNNNNNQQPQSHSHANTENHDSQTSSQYTSVESSNATTTTTTTTATSTITTSTNTVSSEATTNKSPATQIATSQTANQQHHHQHQNQYPHNNNNHYQSPRYNNHYHSHHDSHHKYNVSYTARSSNSNQRGHNSNHNHSNHHHSVHNHHHHTQNHNQHQHHHHLQQTVDESVAVSSSASSSQISDTTTITVSSPTQRQQPAGPPYYVDLHVNAGECVSLQLLDGQEQVVTGPATITMISQQQNPPVPIPVQVPPGHMIHQIADENGTLKHIILSVMDTENGSQLNSTIITLPKGTFRIDSNGELVSIDGGDGVTMNTLPQQVYFANYDGCPVAYDATTLSEPIETPTAAPIAQTLVSDISYATNAAGGQCGDRQQSYTGHYSHQPYNNIVTSGHNHHHHQQHYKASEMNNSPGSYKSQTLLSNQGGPMAGSYSPVYSSFDSISGTMTNAVSPFNNKPVRGGNQGNHNGNHHHHHSNHQQQASNYSRNSNSDNFLQRNKEQVSYNDHANSYGSATGVRKQHNSENNKRQTLSLDKTSDQQQHNTNRYTTANIKVISNNHSLGGGSQPGNSLTQAGSISPVRTRVKGGNHHNLHQTNGLRNSNHYNGQSNAMHHLHDIKEKNLLSKHSASSSLFHTSPSSSSTRDSSNLKSSRNNVHSQNQTGVISKHINHPAASIGQYLLHSNNSHNIKQQGLAWQHNKISNAIKNIPATQSATIRPDSELSGDNNSVKGSTASTTQSQTSGAGDLISGKRNKNNSNDVISTELNKEQMLPTNKDHASQLNKSDKIELKLEDTTSRSSRGKQKKCQNQILIQTSDRQSDRHSNNVSNNSNSNKLSETSNKSPSTKHLDEADPELAADEKTIPTTDKAITSSLNEAGSDSKLNQDRETTVVSSSKQVKSQSQKRVNARDKSTSQSSRKTVSKELSEVKLTQSETAVKPTSTASKVAIVPRSESSTNVKHTNIDRNQTETISKIDPNNDTVTNRVVVKTTSVTTKLSTGSRSESSTNLKHTPTDKYQFDNDSESKLSQDTSNNRMSANKITGTKIVNECNGAENLVNSEQSKHKNKNNIIQLVDSPIKSSLPARTGSRKTATGSGTKSTHSKATQQVKFSHLIKHCRTRFVTVVGKLVQKSLSTYSDTKFAGLLLTVFTIFAMLLAIFIHYYIVSPVTE